MHKIPQIIEIKIVSDAEEKFLNVVCQRKISGYLHEDPSLIFFDERSLTLEGDTLDRARALVAEVLALDIEAFGCTRKEDAPVLTSEEIAAIEPSVWDKIKGFLGF
jgi:hypothetical protein